MLRLLICSVGTSLLSGKDRPWKWSPGGARELPDSRVVQEWLEQADPVQASAETNTLSRLEVGSADRIVFLHSDTPDGTYCAVRLAEYYRSRARAVELKRIGQLGYGAKSFSRGLKSLIDLTCGLVRQAWLSNTGENIVICATGGFKAEIAYLNLLGALLQVEVVYIYEQHEGLVSLPRLPLSWDTDLALRNKEFFEWIEAEPRRPVEVESWLNREPALRDLVEDGDDGHVYLSPAGLLLYRAALQHAEMRKPVEWPEPSPLLPEEKPNFQGKAHERPRGWERYVARLCQIGCVAQVAYDHTGVMRQGERVRILDPERGVIGVRYGEIGDSLPIRVETTARGEEQTRLVADYIRGLPVK